MVYTSEDIMNLLQVLVKKVDCLERALVEEKAKYDLMEVSASELMKLKKIGLAELERREKRGLLKPVRKYRDAAGRVHRRYRLSDVIDSDKKVTSEKEQIKASIEQKKQKASSVSSKDIFLNARKKIVGL